ncbi:MAG TPA: tetratricopeptide repeat protein, partial [Bacteroidia bacterium]|nr:tetratricopeptide repeat protein [Bacteroidia bacterium]
MKRISSLLLLMTLWGSLCLATNPLDSGNAAYARKAYALAIQEYEQISKDGKEAPELYYNLGNAYLKNRNIPMAILNYERALREKPDDEDIRFNLKIANSQIADKVEEKPEHVLLSWKHKVLGWMSESAWCLSGIVCFLVFLGLLAWYVSGT